MSYSVSVTAVLWLLLAKYALACTYVRTSVSAADGFDTQLPVLARSMEVGFAGVLPLWSVTIVPRMTPEFRKFFTIVTDSSDYPPFHINEIGFVAINVPVSFNHESLSQPIGNLFNLVFEGQNEYGLSISALAFDGSKYQKWNSDDCTSTSKGIDCSQNGKHQLAWIDLVPYLLGTFRSAQDAIYALQNEVVVTRPELFTYKELGETGMHWTIDDAEGNSFVIEYIEGELKVHKNTVGVLTNDPDFSWQVQNLNNYANVRASTPKVSSQIRVDQPSDLYPEPFRNMVPFPSSHGGGLLGLPGDLSPPGRFARVFYLRSLAEKNGPASNLKFALAMAQNVLNTVTIPFGSVTPSETQPGFNLTIGTLLSNYELTQWCVLKVPSHGRFYLRNYVNSAWKLINISSINFESTTLKSSSVYDYNEPF